MIKSYVKREGRITERQKYALENYWSFYGLTVDQGRVDFSQCFARQAPTILEIGFGMGNSLFEMAHLNAEMNFIGIEVHRPGVGALIANLQEHEMTNVKIFQEDAQQVLTHCISNNSLSKIQIFFPDPWPKLRHHKRRLIQNEFIQLLEKKLMSKGILHLATDWEDYAEHIMKVLTQNNNFENKAGEGQYSENKNLRPKTKFEIRGEKLGHITRDLLFIKKASI